MRPILTWAVAAVSLCLPLFACVFPAQAAIEGTTWFPLGPAPIDGFFRGGVSGRATAIAANPDNPDEIWVGTAAGGVWHTVDAGVNWEPLGDREESLAIGSLAVDQCSGAGCGRIYAGTGENAIRRDTYHGAGLLVGQVSGGEFPSFGWTLRPTDPSVFRGGSINDVILDPTTSGGSKRIFVTLSSGVTVAAPESTVTAPEPAGGFGLYRSDDAGLTFDKLTVAGSAGARPTDLERLPDGTLLAGFLGRGVFRSNDDGTSWCPLSPDVPKPPGCPDAQWMPSYPTTYDFVEIAFAPSDPSVLYASFGMCPDRLIQSCRPAFYRTSDDGTTWTRQVEGSESSGLDYCGAALNGYSRYTHALAVDPTQSETLIAGGLRLWRSTDGGGAFNQSDATAPGVVGAGAAVVHLDQREVVFHPTAVGRAYATGDGGFALSDDGGITWTPRNDDLQITGFHGLDSSPLTGAVFGTSQDNGGQLWYGSRRWNWMACCGDGGFAIMDANTVTTLYAGSNWGAPKRSTNGGVSWSTIANGIPSTEHRLFYAPFVQAPSLGGNNMLYWGGTRLYRSPNDGSTWSAASPVLATGEFDEIVTGPSETAHLAGPGQNVITAIAISSSDPDRVWVGYYGGEIFRSDPEPCPMESCWERVDAGVPDQPVTGLAIDPGEPARVVATLSGFGGGAKVWRTTTNGASWSSAGGLPSGVPANTVAFEAGPPQRVWVGTDSSPDGSLFRSTDGGASFSPFNAGLPNAPVYRLAVNETFGRIFLATHGRGAFVLGRPFVSNFEGWVDDRIWDLPVYGQSFLPNQSCELEVIQSDGTVCAAGPIDAMGGTIGTDGGGVLETSQMSMYSGHQVAWACYGGDCVGGVPIESCYDDADSDGVDDPLSSIRLVCDGGDIATAQVIGCPPLENPPSTEVTLPSSPGGAGSGNLCGSTVSALSTAAPAGTPRVLYLTASVQRRLGTESLCTVRVPYVAGEPDAEILRRAQERIDASPVCAAAGVRAIVDEGLAGTSEDEFPRPPRLILDAPSVVGGQLVTAIRLEPDAGGQRCVHLDGLGVPLVNTIHILGIMLDTPPEGATGGELTVTEDTPIGSCSITIPTAPGQTAAQIAAAMVDASRAPGIPGPHPACPARYNPRDLSAQGEMLVTVFARGVTVCTDDPNLGVDLRSEELQNVHPVADAGGDRPVPLGEPIQLDASASTDPDSSPGTEDDLVLYEWFDVSGGSPVALGGGVTLELPALPEGPRRIRLKVTDQGGLSDLDEVLLGVGGSEVLGTEGPGWSFGLFGGATLPLGDLSDGTDAGVHGRLTAAYRFTPRFQLVAGLGLSQLGTEPGSASDDTRFVHLTLSPRLTFPSSSGRPDPFVELGVGGYRTRTGDELGLSVGLGLRHRLRPRVALELGVDVHHVVDGLGGLDDADFLAARIGFSFR